MKSTESTAVMSAGIAIVAVGGVSPENAGKDSAEGGRGSLITDNFGW